jgi:hypothetical protein
MRFAGAVLLVALLQRGQAPLPPAVPLEPGSVDGVVVEALSGRPLSAATVQLQLINAGSYVTSTRDDGTFLFRNVPPGNYVLQAARGGYIPESYGPAPINYSAPMQQLAPGQKLSGIRLALTKGAVISGRLIDDRGELVVGAVVQALKTTYSGGLRERKSVLSTVSNDLGEYRLFMLRPGEYHISVIPSRQRETIPLYFPGTIDAKAAQPLDLHEGETLAGVNFPSIPTRTRRVTGSVQGHGGDPVGVLLSPVNGTSAVARTLDPKDLVFEFNDVAPGSYMLVARGSSMRSAIPLDVRNADMLNMRISLGAGFRIPTRVRIEGHAAGDDPELEKVYFVLRPETAVPGLEPETYSPFANGRLTLDALAGDYRIDITQPEDAYVKALSLGGVDVLNQGLRLTGSTDATLEMLIASDSGSIEGRAAGSATVVLVPEAARRGQRALFKSMKAGPAGDFRFTKVPPGNYKLFAWAAENGGPWLDPEYLRKYEDRGTPLRIDANQRAVLDRTVIPVLD